MRPVQIEGRLVGPGQPCFVIAEAGVNHDGEVERALRLVDVAAEAGAGAVKFQTFAADRLVTADAPKAEYQKQAGRPGETQYDMLRRLELSREAHDILIARARRLGLLLLSTPFDEESADLLEALDVPAFKMASGEITNLPFLAHVAAKRRPVILSTGMSSLEEVEDAVTTVRRTGTGLVLLHCVSNYPADPAEANLRAMDTLARAFDVPVGFSDHTAGIEVSLAAVALGASVIEKHVTLDRTSPGPDHRASLEPAELAALIRGVRRVEAALGDGCKRAMPSEVSMAAVARRSLVAARDLPAGVTLTADMVVSRRPGTGIPPSMRDAVLGRRLRSPVPRGALLEYEMLL